MFGEKDRVKTTIFVMASKPYAFILAVVKTCLTYHVLEMSVLLYFLMFLGWTIPHILAHRTKNVRTYFYGMICSALVSLAFSIAIFGSENRDWVLMYLPFESKYWYILYWPMNVLGIQLVIWLQYQLIVRIYRKLKKVCITTGRKILAVVLCLALCGSTVAGVKIYDRDPTSFLDKASYIEIEWIRDFVEYSYVYKDRDAEMFQKIIEMFDSHTYKKDTRICMGDLSIGMKFYFYDQDQRLLGVIAKHTSSNIEINKRHWEIEDGELEVEIVGNMVIQTLNEGMWQKME